MHARCARVELLRSSHAARRATPAHPPETESAQRVNNALIWKPALFRNLEYLNRGLLLKCEMGKWTRLLNCSSRFQNF